MSGFVPGVEYKAYLAERSTRLAAQHKEVRRSLIHEGALRPLFLPEAQEQALAILEQLLTEAAAEPVDLNAVADAVEDLEGLMIVRDVTSNQMVSSKPGAVQNGTKTWGRVS